MRILVNDIAADSGGVLTVLKDFYEYVKANDKENEWIFLVGGEFIQETDRIRVIALPQIKKSYWKRLLFDFFTGRKLINGLKPDVVFSLQNTVTFGVKAPQAVYEHQPLPFQTVKNYSFLKAAERKMAVYQHLIGQVIRLSAKKADKVFVQTQWMQAAMVKAKVRQARIVKVAPNVEELSRFRVDLPRRKDLFFYPTSTVPYKNVDCICRAAEILEERKLSFEVELTVPEEKPQKHIKRIGQVSRETVLRKFCEGTLVFPSYIETFGYPLIEAAQMGAVILAADLSFAHEVLGDYENAYYFDPFDPAALADLMEKVISGQIRCKEVRRRVDTGINSWQIVVDELIKTAEEAKGFDNGNCHCAL